MNLFIACLTNYLVWVNCKKIWVIFIDSHPECKIVRFPCKLFRANGVISCQNINTVTKSLLIRWHGWLRLKINYHEFYPVSLKPVVLQLGSRQKDRKKILFKPSINSRALHWNDVVSFDDLLFRFLFDLRVI